MNKLKKVRRNIFEKQSEKERERELQIILKNAHMSVCISKRKQSKQIE